jgi:hypothetical protein
MKYVIFRVDFKDGGGLEVPIVFPELCVHSLIAEAVQPTLEKHWEGSTATPISAGFLSSTGFLDECHGKSDTLKLESRGEQDTALIRLNDYGAAFF